MNREIKEILGLDDYIENGDASLQVQMTVAYWRKANAIHKWFVDNCQGGVDECQVSWVTREKLVELRDLCVRASDDKDSTLLPTTSGFFFGSTEVDEFYWDDIADTALKLSAIIADEKKIEEIDHQIDDVKEKTTIIKEYYHEQGQAINSFNSSQLDSFFAKRYGY